MEAEVRKVYPHAGVVSGTLGGKTKYRVENRTALRKDRPLSGWRDTQAEAWADALKRLGAKP